VEAPRFSVVKKAAPANKEAFASENDACPTLIRDPTFWSKSNRRLDSVAKASIGDDVHFTTLKRGASTVSQG
jgi:hypothetical protein